MFAHLEMLFPSGGASNYQYRASEISGKKEKLLKRERRERERETKGEKGEKNWSLIQTRVYESI